MKKIILTSGLLVLSSQVLSTGIEGFNDLQSRSETFVRATCGGFVVNQDAENALQQDLFDVCSSMVNSVNDLTGSEGTAESRELSADVLAGGFQNIVPEETLAPISIASNTSSINMSAINTRLAKIRFGGGAGDEDGLFSTTRLGFFINGTGGIGETDRSNEQDASEFDSKGFLAGFDYKITDDLIVGLAGGYSFFELDFDENRDVAGGSVDSDNYSLTAYSNYNWKGLYVDGVFTYGWSDYGITRRIFIDSNSSTIGQVNRTAVANPDGEQFSVSLASGYDFHSGSFNYGPYARIAYFETEIDSYNEKGAGGLNLRVDEHKADSLETVLGLQLSYALSQSFGVLIPHARAEWHHEFKNSQRSFDVSYVNDPRNNANIYRSLSGNPDRNFFNVSGGLSAVLKHGIQVFLDYETILGLSDIETHKFSAGVRIEL